MAESIDGVLWHESRRMVKVVAPVAVHRISFAMAQDWSSRKRAITRNLWSFFRIQYRFRIVTHVAPASLPARDLTQRNEVRGDGRTLPRRWQVQDGLRVRPPCIHRTSSNIAESCLTFATGLGVPVACLTTGFGCIGSSSSR